MFKENYQYTLKMTADEAELIFALLAHVRLGNGDVYTNAAHELLDRMVTVVGDDFGNDVHIGATITKENGQEYVTLEVDMKELVPVAQMSFEFDDSN